MDRLNYRGNVDLPENYVGPDNWGAFYRPISKSYDAESDRTTIEFLPVPPGEMNERYGHMLDAAEDRVLIKTMFGSQL